MIHDFAIIGGGIIGLATARELTVRYPDARVLVLEKEDRWAAHQSGRNSGVLHSGIYYRPGSLKARLCREGHAAMIEFCGDHRIRCELTGKVIVATEVRQLSTLAELERRGRANGLEVERIGPEELREIEPHAVGIAALRVPAAGIVDFPQVAATFARIVDERGGDLRLRTEVRSIAVEPDAVTVDSETETFRARCLINCAGLHSDRITRMAGERPAAKIVPFRGEYYVLRPERADLVRALIYPVPDPRTPFLGVHFTRDIDGAVHAGPNAVLSFKREGYRWSDVELRDVAEVLGYAGFWRLARRYWRTGVMEMYRSLSRRAFVRSLRKLVPEVRAEDLVRGGSGVRAQALTPDGRLVDDFLIVERDRSIHVCNAPSPAATSAIPIARTLVDRAATLHRPHSRPARAVARS